MSTIPSSDYPHCGTTEVIPDRDRIGFQPLTVKCLLFCIFLYVGISVVLPGCTLIFIEKSTGSREDEVALIFSSRSVGILAGWLLSMLTPEEKIHSQLANLLLVGLFGLCAVYGFLIWTSHVWWVMCGYVFQGFFMTLTTKGCADFIKRYKLNYKPHWSQHMLFTCLLGCCITSFVLTILLHPVNLTPNPRGLSFVPTRNDSNSANFSTILTTDSSPLKRSARSIPSSLSDTSFIIIPPTNQSSVSTIDNAHHFTSSVTSTTVMTTATTSVPTKPTVIDAKHLNQDASSADGSKTASQMKQLHEDQKMDAFASAPVSEGKTKVNVLFKVVPAPGTLPVVHPAEKVLSTTVGTTLLMGTPSIISTRAKSTPSYIVSSMQTPSSPPSSVKSSIINISANHSVFNHTTSPHIALYGHIAEHDISSSLTPQPPFLVQWSPLQRVHLSLIVIGLLLLLLTLAHTDLCGLHVYRLMWNPIPTVSTTVLRLRPISPYTTRLASRDPSEVGKGQSELSTRYLTASHASDQISNLSEADRTQYFSADEDMQPVPNTDDVPCCSSTPIEKFSEDRFFPVKSPTWPRPSVSQDLVLLLAEFCNIGLETTFSAFIHGFAIRYLFWSSAVAFLAVGIFWFGDLIGRLPKTLVSNLWTSFSASHRSMGSPTRTLSTDRSQSSTSSMYIVRICGALICVISGAILTHYLSSSVQYTLVAITNPSSKAPHPSGYIVWLSCSLLLGLGLGMSCSDAGSIIPGHHDQSQTVRRLQLAGILGQMTIPAFVAYAHRLSLFWHYTGVLANSVLLLAVIQCISLVVHVIICSMRRHSGYLPVPPESSSESSPSLSSEDSPSSVTLYAVND